MFKNTAMKKRTLIAILFLLPALAACAPVLNRDLMRQGERDFRLSQLAEAPDGRKGRLFILGGSIVNTKLVEAGSLIEAVYVPVDSYGYLRNAEHYQGRFLALLPKARGLLDPLIYTKGREITIAGEFQEIRPGKIDEMEYAFPYFEIKQIYLWEERTEYRWPYYYPYSYWSPWCYDPWGRPYHCPPHWYGPRPW